MALKKTGSAAVILNDQGEVLLVKHGYGPLNWEIPGGGSEPNESPLENALREVFEETRLVVSAQHMSGLYYIEERDELGFVFLCRIESGVPIVNDPTEITEIAFWPVDALPRPIPDWTVQRIRDAVNGCAQSIPTTVKSVTILT